MGLYKGGGGAYTWTIFCVSVNNGDKQVGLYSGGLIFGWAYIWGAYIWNEVSVSTCGGLIFGMR